MLKEMANEEQLAEFEKIRDADFSYEIPGLARFRVNAHFQRARHGGHGHPVIKDKVPPSRT